MLQIDDAGSGSFIGGTCIGIYRPETNEYYFDIVPVELYSRENFKKKFYLDDVVRIVSEGIRCIGMEKGETVEFCRGYMFDRVKSWLQEKNLKWYCTQISGKAQEVVERNFELYTERLGLPGHYIKYTRYPFHFHKLLRWVYADFENRISLCKVGWKCWQKLESQTPQVIYGTMEFPFLSCLKCGKRIYTGSRIKILKYTSNRDNYVYLHESC